MFCCAKLLFIIYFPTTSRSCLPFISAINKLLKHSVNGPSVGAAGAMVKYVKIGNLDTAIKDFYSVKPIVSGLPASGIYKKKVRLRPKNIWVDKC